MSSINIFDTLDCVDDDETGLGLLDNPSFKLPANFSPTANREPKFINAVKDSPINKLVSGGKIEQMNTDEPMSFSRMVLLTDIKEDHSGVKKEMHPQRNEITPNLILNEDKKMHTDHKGASEIDSLVVMGLEIDDQVSPLYHLDPSLDKPKQSMFTFSKIPSDNNTWHSPNFQTKKSPNRSMNRNGEGPQKDMPDEERITNEKSSHSKSQSRIKLSGKKINEVVFFN